MCVVCNFKFFAPKVCEFSIFLSLSLFQAEPRLVPQRGGLPAAPSSLPGPGAPGGGGGLLLPPGPAPHPAPPGFHATLTEIEATPNPLEPKKKKYAKEAWPGKKPMPSLLV